MRHLLFCIHFVYLFSVLWIPIRTFKILPVQLLWKSMKFVYPPFYISFLSNLVKPFSILKKIAQSFTIFLVNYCIENNIWGCTRSLRDFRASQQHMSLASVMNDFWRLWWPMISGDGWGLSFPEICLTVEEKPRRKPQRGKLNRPVIEPAPAAGKVTMLPLDQSGGLLDNCNIIVLVLYIWSFRARLHQRSMTPLMNDFWWFWWPILSGDGWSLSLPDIYLTVEENPRKISTRKNDRTGNRTRAR